MEYPDGPIVKSLTKPTIWMYLGSKYVIGIDAQDDFGNRASHRPRCSKDRGVNGMKMPQLRPLMSLSGLLAGP